MRKIDTLIADAKLTETRFLFRALRLASRHVPSGDDFRLAEELWQRLRRKAQRCDDDGLIRLVEDARRAAGLNLRFSARDAHLPPADSYFCTAS